METAYSTTRLDSMQSSWEDILAAMDKNSALLRLSRRYPKNPSKHQSTKSDSQSHFKDEFGRNPPNNARASNGRSYADFLPVSDDEETIADDFEGFMEYNSSSVLSKSESERDFKSNSEAPLYKNIASRRQSGENKVNEHIQINRVNSYPHREPHAANSGGISNTVIIRSKKKVQEFSTGNRRKEFTKTVPEPQTTEGDHQKGLKNIKLRNDGNVQFFSRSRKVNKAKEASLESTRKEVDDERPQHKKKQEFFLDPQKQRADKKRAKKKNTFANSKIKEVLEEVESKINKRAVRIPPTSNSPSSALDQPKSPTDFLRENAKENFSSFSLNNEILDKQQQQNPEAFPTSSGYQTIITPISTPGPGSSKTVTPSEETDVMKVIISKSNNISNDTSLPMFFRRMDFGAPIKTYRYPSPQKTNPLPQGANPFMLDAFPSRPNEYHSLKEYVDLEWLQDEHSSDSSHLFASPSSTNNSQGLHFLASTSSRSSSLWSKYEDMDQNNIAQYAYILRKYGGSMNLEPRKISHVQKNKMELSASKRATSKSYAMDHAKRMLIKLKAVTGNDFELLHERELEDEILSGVKAPKKLPPIGLVTHEQPPSDRKYDYKPNSLKDFRTLPKVRTVPAGSNLSEQQLREMVERAEKKKTLDQAIRERNREMFGTHRRATRAETKVETTAKT